MEAAVGGCGEEDLGVWGQEVEVRLGGGRGGDGDVEEV